MITNISLMPLAQRYIRPSALSFKSYKKTYEDIKIYSKDVDAQISTMSGDVDIKDSRINGKISGMSGDISILSSKVNGDIKNLSGDIIVKNNTEITGNIENISGDTILHNSFLKGNVSSVSGDIIMRDSTVDGTVKSMAKNIKLEGENIIDELVILGAKKGIEKSEAEVKSELAKKGIFINGSIGHINNVSNITIVNCFNYKTGDYKTSIVEPSLDFKLPKNSKIKLIRFDSDKEGVVLLEKGRKFCGKIINGVIKRI